MNKLLLVPTSLSGKPLADIHPEYVINQLRKADIFVVETAKIGREHLRGLYDDRELRDLEIVEYNKKSPRGILESLIEDLNNGKTLLYISDAGFPAIADDGTELVKQAQINKIEIKTFGGQSSLLQTLASSGLNSENFEYIGYLPVEAEKRDNVIRQLESVKGKAIIFIEAPYRVQTMYEALLRNLKPYTLLCLGINLETEKELVVTQKVEEWRKETEFRLGKDQVVFIVQS
jgi:16S rRNA (cytidine1402-2'-O)-methyltransferase